MSPPTNPVQRARAALDLTRLQLAALLDVGYDRVGAAESFRLKHLPPGWRGPLEAAGMDFDALARDYRTARASLVRQEAASHGR